jgi:ABC-type tungstate transport system substrate-binding protein
VPTWASALIIIGAVLLVFGGVVVDICKRQVEQVDREHPQTIRSFELADTVQ